MFNKTNITLDKIVNLALSSIIKRKLLGIGYGTVVVAEGVFHDLDPQEIKNAGVSMTYDEHGHPELGKISKAVLFNDILEKKFKESDLKVKTRPVEIGYDVRCIDPIAYDVSYCTELAMGVYDLFAAGETGCMVYVDPAGNSKPLYLKNLQNEEGKIPPRRVDITNGICHNYYEYICHYITPEDYEAAKKYVANPEEYDFKKILNW
jgi:6-phosphofructokinase 1